MPTRSIDMTSRLQNHSGHANRCAGIVATEALLEIGVRARFLARHDLSLVDAARALRVHPRLALLGILFVTSPDVLKFRAMLEEWTTPKILNEIRQTLVR